MVDNESLSVNTVESESCDPSQASGDVNGERGRSSWMDAGMVATDTWIAEDFFKRLCSMECDNGARSNNERKQRMQIEDRYAKESS